MQSLLAKLSGKRVLVVGDLMLDHFLRGKVSRISPEAPVPVVSISEESHMPGGAGNVCSNMAALGGRVALFSVIGDDLAGNQLNFDLQERGIDTSGVLLDPSRVTTQKSRVVAEHQQVVRYDRETLRPLSPAQQAALLRALGEALRTADALVISDYGKGIVTPGLVSGALRAAHARGLPVVVDPKVEHFRRYRGVDCITPNLQEAWGGMRRHPRGDDGDLLRLGESILTTLRVRSVLITRGEKGMSLFERGTRARHIPTQAREVFDVTGAGDTVVGVMALGLASGGSLFDSAVLANAAAGIVVGKLSTATVSTEELRGGVALLDGARR